MVASSNRMIGGSVASPEVYLLLQSLLDWDAERSSEWLSRALATFFFPKF
jgi:hypothetical protein